MRWASRFSSSFLHWLPPFSSRTFVWGSTFFAKLFIFVWFSVFSWRIIWKQMLFWLVACSRVLIDSCSHTKCRPVRSHILVTRSVELVDGFSEMVVGVFSLFTSAFWFFVNFAPTVVKISMNFGQSFVAGALLLWWEDFVERHGLCLLWK